MRDRRPSQCPTIWRGRVAGDRAAQATFETLTSQNRYAILYRIETLERADARARRIEKYVTMLARGDTIHPQRRGQGG